MMARSLSRGARKERGYDFYFLGIELLQQLGKQADLLQPLGGIRNALGCFDDSRKQHPFVIRHVASMIAG